MGVLMDTVQKLKKFAFNFGMYYTNTYVNTLNLLYYFNEMSFKRGVFNSSMYHIKITNISRSFSYNVLLIKMLEENGKIQMHIK